MKMKTQLNILSILLLFSSVYLLKAEKIRHFDYEFLFSTQTVVNSNNEIFIPSGHYGISTFDYDIELLRVNRQFSSLFPNEHFREITFDRYENMWIGCNNSLMYVTDTSLTVYNTENTDLPYFKVLRLVVDRNNTLWFSIQRPNRERREDEQYTDFKLVKRVNKNDYIIFDSTNSQLSKYFVNYIAVDSLNNVWTASVGLLKIKEDGSQKLFTFNRDLSSFLVTYVSVSPDNEIWFSHGDTLMIFDGENEESLRTIPLSNMHDGGWTYITCITFDKEGSVWVSMFGDPVIRIKDGVLTKYYEVIEDGKVYYIVTPYHICIDQNNNKWIATFLHGVFVFNENGINFNKKPSSKRPEDILIYPNPASEEISVYIKPQQAQEIKSEIYNSIGKLLFAKKFYAVFPGERELNIDMSSYPDGVYYCRIFMDGRYITKKIVKVGN